MLDDKKNPNEIGVPISDIAFKWAEEVGQKYEKCKDLKPTKNRTKDFKNGELFKAIIHDALKGTKNEIKLEEMERKTPKETIKLVLELAENKLGIPRLFNVEDIEEPIPKESLIVPFLLAVKAVVHVRNANQIGGGVSGRNGESFSSLPVFLREGNQVDDLSSFPSRKLNELNPPLKTPKNHPIAPTNLPPLPEKVFYFYFILFFFFFFFF